MTTTADDPSLGDLIATDAPLQRLGDGYQFTEGPVWSVAEQCLYFSDIPSDVRWRWTSDGGMAIDRTPSYKANGLVIGTDGELIACDQVTSMVVRYPREEPGQVLAFHHRGHYLNSPNDVVVRAVDGAIYFTDPDFGRWNDWIGQARSRTMGYHGLYRVPAEGGVNGEAELLVATDEFDQPNGLCFSPDESLLYVNDSPRAQIKVFSVNPDGTLGRSEIFADQIGISQAADDGRTEAERHQEIHDAGAVDGMKCDAEGNVWVTGPGGVWVFAPDGRRLGRLACPEVVGNLTWGGADLRTLFVMTTNSVHAVDTLIGPAPLAHH